MTALEAARMGDEVGHTSAFAGLIAGAIVGLAIGAAILFTVVTAGAGGVLIGAAIAGGIGLGAGGALAGMEIGKMSDADACGNIKTGSPDTFIEAKKAARAKLDIVSHGDKKVAQGSVSVYVNAMPLARRTEKSECGGIMSKTCSFTFIGGDTVTLVPIEEDVPSWLVTGLTWTAWIAGGAALILTGVGAGAMIAGLGLVGSVAGGYIFGKLGHAIGGLWGEKAARIGEIVGEFGGALLGGVAAVKFGSVLSTPKVAPKLEAPAAKVEPAPAPKVEPAVREQFGEGASSKVYREGDSVVKVVKSEVAADGGEKVAITKAQREFIAENTVEFTNQIHEKMPTVPKMELVEPGTMKQPFAEGKQLFELQGNREAFTNAKAQVKEAVGNAHDAIGLGRNQYGEMQDGFLLKIDPNTANFRFDSKGNIVSWFDPVSVVPPAPKAPAVPAAPAPEVVPNASPAATPSPAAPTKPPAVIHPGKQGKHVPGHNNFQPGKSELTHPDPQALINKGAGTGVKHGDNKEVVDFGEPIGVHVAKDGTRTPTSRGTIHYDQGGGAHIVPAAPSATPGTP